MKPLLRSLAASPGLSLVTLLTIALGLAAAGAIFAVARAVLFRPLPFQDEESLAWVWSTRPDRDRAFFSIPHFLDLRAANTTTADLAAVTPLGINVTGLGETERVSGWRVTANLYAVLGTRAHLGRLPSPAEEQADAAPVAVLGYGYWQRRFGGDPGVVGRPLTLNGTAHVIAGVLPPEFFLPTNESNVLLSQPLDRDPRREQRGIQFLRLVARLKSGVTPEMAQAEFKTLTDTIVRRHPATDAAITPPRFVPLRIEAMAGYRNSLLVLLGAAGLLLLILGTNLAGLMAARALARSRDAAVRLALGARPLQLFRSTLLECFVLTAAGGILGLIGCALALPSLLALAPANLPRADFVALDGATSAVILGSTLLIGLGIGIAPALRLSRLDPHAVLQGSGSLGATGRSAARQLLVAAQIALCTVLLVGSGLLVRSLQRILAVQPGFDDHGVLAVQVSLPDASRGLDGLATFADELTRRLRELPGVESASLTSMLPLSGINTRSEFNRADRPPADPKNTLSAANRYVLPDYFRTVRIPLHAGRDFRDDDHAASKGVAIIDQALAEKFWPGENPIGATILLRDGRGQRELEIVGVAGATKHFSLEEAATPAIYLPVRQMTPALLPFFVSRMNFVVRTSADPAALKEPARRVLHTLDPEAALTLRTLTETVAWAKAPRIFNLRLLGFFAAVAVLLASIGLFAITSESVAVRTREIGIRVALGATSQQIARQVLGGSTRLTLVGLAAGLGLTLALAPFGVSLLYGVRVFDPVSYLIAAGTLAAVALFASWLPARRAMRVDPLIALRRE